MSLSEEHILCDLAAAHKTSTMANTKVDVLLTKVDALPVQMSENLLTSMSVELNTLMISFRECFQDYLAIERDLHAEQQSTIRMVGESAQCSSGIRPLFENLGKARIASARVKGQLEVSFRQMHEYFLKIASILGHHGKLIEMEFTLAVLGITSTQILSAWENATRTELGVCEQLTKVDGTVVFHRVIADQLTALIKPLSEETRRLRGEILCGRARRHKWSGVRDDAKAPARTETARRRLRT